MTISILYVLMSVIGIIFFVQIKRPCVFKFKIVIVFLVPIILAYTNYTKEYFEIISVMFSILIMFLYWREVKTLTTHSGLYKRQILDFIETFPVMVWMKDQQGNFIYTNDNARKQLFLLSEDELIGKNIFDVSNIHKNNNLNYTFAQVCENTDQIIKQSKNPSIFFQYGHIDYNLTIHQVYKMPILDDQKKVIGIIGCGYNITSEVQEHEKLKNLIEKKDYLLAYDLIMKHREKYRISYEFTEEDLKKIHVYT